MINALRIALGSVFAIALVATATAKPESACPSAGCAPAASCGAAALPGAISLERPRRFHGHGGWLASIKGQTLLIMCRLKSGATFALLHDGMWSAVLLKIPSWHLEKDQTMTMQISVDGRVFSATATALNPKAVVWNCADGDFVETFYQGRIAWIAVDGRDLPIMHLPDAAATLRDVRMIMQLAR